MLAWVRGINILRQISQRVSAGGSGLNSQKTGFSHRGVPLPMSPLGVALPTYPPSTSPLTAHPHIRRAVLHVSDKPKIECFKSRFHGAIIHFPKGQLPKIFHIGNGHFQFKTLNSSPTFFMYRISRKRVFQIGLSP